jgi:hypothetical protein
LTEINAGRECTLSSTKTLPLFIVQSTNNNMVGSRCRGLGFREPQNIYRATVFKTDGTVDEVIAPKSFFNFEWLEGQVSGRIKIFPFVKTKILVVNADGHLHGLPRNPVFLHGGFCGNVIRLDIRSLDI